MGFDAGQERHLFPLQPDGSLQGISHGGLSCQQGSLGLGPVQQPITIIVPCPEEGTQGGPVHRQPSEVLIQQRLHEGLCWNCACLHILQRCEKLYCMHLFLFAKGFCTLHCMCLPSHPAILVSKDLKPNSTRHGARM